MFLRVRVGARCVLRLEAVCLLGLLAAAATCCKDDAAVCCVSELASNWEEERVWGESQHGSEVASLLEVPLQSAPGWRWMNGPVRKRSEEASTQKKTRLSQRTKEKRTKNSAK